MSTEVVVDKVRLAPTRSHARRVSWGAILAGLFVTVVLQLLLTLLGVAVGAATFDPLREQNPTHGLSLGAGIWLLVTGLISVWVGSCVAGRLCNGPLLSDGLLHGVVTWSVSTCLTMFLLASTGGALLGGTGAMLTGALAIGGAVGNQNADLASLQDSVKLMFPQATPSLAPTGRPIGISNPDQSLADQKSPQPNNAMRGLSQGALWGCIALVLGLLVSAGGGWTGTASIPSPTDQRVT